MAIKVQWCAILKQFSPDVRLEVYEAVFDYLSTGNVGPLSARSEVAFAFIRYEIDAASERREKASRRREEKKEVGAEVEIAAEIEADAHDSSICAAKDDGDMDRAVEVPDKPVSTRVYRRYPRKLKKKMKLRLKKGELYGLTGRGHAWRKIDRFGVAPALSHVSHGDVEQSGKRA